MNLGNLEFGAKQAVYTVKSSDPWPNTPVLTVCGRDLTPNEDGKKRRPGARMEVNSVLEKALNFAGAKVKTGVVEHVLVGRQYEDEKLAGIFLINATPLMDELDDAAKATLIRYNKNSSLSNKPLYDLIRDFVGKTDEAETFSVKINVVDHDSLGKLGSIGEVITEDYEKFATTADSSEFVEQEQDNELGVDETVNAPVYAEVPAE